LWNKLVYNEVMSLLNQTITTLGIRASQLLAQSHSASIWGSTSQGIFLHLPPQGITFLSFEPHHGPLTANLAGDLAYLRRVSSSEGVQMDGERITFPALGIDLVWRDAPVWDVPPLMQASVQIEAVLERYREVNRLVSAHRSPSVRNGHGEEAISLIRPDAELSQVLLLLLGQGVGLTPAGDDVILGCLLALSRWGQVFSTSLDIRGLSQSLIAQAYHRTTLLSANLIECAAEGQADERLVQALDGIFTGQLSAEGCADLLLAWGHSSGVEALRGMGIMIKLVRDTARDC
jgi:hypothetical protein